MDSKILKIYVVLLTYMLFYGIITASPIPKNLEKDDTIEPIVSKYPIKITPIYGDGKPIGNVDLLEFDYNGVRYVYLRQNHSLVKIKEFELE